jgi:hypothetical protein
MIFRVPPIVQAGTDRSVADESLVKANLHQERQRLADLTARSQAKFSHYLFAI